jgi:hypothetical protein
MSTYRLSYADAVDVWVLHLRGEFQHLIAAKYGVNQGRINDVLKERMHSGSKQAALKQFGL